MKQGLPLLSFMLMSVLMTSCVTERIYSGTNVSIKEREIDKLTASKERLRLGITYLQKGNAEQAKYNLDRALFYAPHSEEVHLGLAHYYQTVGDLVRAEKAYQTAVQSSYASGDAKNNFGTFLCKQKRYDEAEVILLSAIETPKYTRIASSYENLGICSREADQTAQAIQYFEKALQYDSRRATSLIELTELLIENKEFLSAKKLLNRYHRGQAETAKSLAFKIKIEQALGENAAVKNLGVQLLAKFPTSVQAKQYQASLDQ